jgi:hypothetical protein
LRFEQCRRNAFALRYDERTVATLTLGVNQPRDCLRLGARFANDQDVCLRTNRERDLQVKGLDGSTGSDEGWHLA